VKNRRLGFLSGVAAWLVAFSAVLGGAGGTFAQARSFPDAAATALAWVETQQQPDGSFAGFGAGSTVDVLLALLASGADPDAYSKGGNTPVAFLESKAGELAKTPGGAGKLLIAVATLGRGSLTFGGVDLVAAFNSTYDAATGQYGKDAIGHAFAMLGLKVANQPVPPAAVARLKALQGPEGGWAFTGETTPGAADTNTTAVAVQALVAAGEEQSSAVLQKARAYLLTQQNTDGGFPYQKEGEFGGESDVNSTSYVSQALIELNDFENSDKAKAYIVSLQKPSGAIQWKASEPDDNAGATYQAIPALLDVTLARPYDRRIAVGMPATGMPESLVGLIAAVAVLTLAVGFAVRRKQPAA
jgi:hypothetical protein